MACICVVRELFPEVISNNILNIQKELRSLSIRDLVRDKISSIAQCYCLTNWETALGSRDDEECGHQRIE